MSIDPVYNLVDWGNLFALVEKVGPQLDERKNRFDKSDIFEQALEMMSGGALKWVDKVGWDHESRREGTKMIVTHECKSQKHCLRTKTGKKKETVSNIKIMNSLGSCSERSIEEIIKFDNLLIIDTGNQKSFSAGVIKGSDITFKYLNVKTDGATLSQFPLSKVHMVYEKALAKTPSVAAFSYLDAKRRMQREMIKRFMQ